jgi:hypothetical protein
MYTAIANPDRERFERRFPEMSEYPFGVPVEKLYPAAVFTVPVLTRVRSAHWYSTRIT